MSVESIAANPFLVYFLFTWSIFWKGLALWRTAKYSQRNWYLVLLIINTFGILEILYLFKYAKKRFSFSELRS